MVFRLYVCFPLQERAGWSFFGSKSGFDAFVTVCEGDLCVFVFLSGGYNSVVRVSVCGTESAGSIPAIRPRNHLYTRKKVWSCGPGAR